MKLNLYLLFCIVLIISSKTHAQIITTYAGNGIAGYDGDGGPATLAKLQGPNCVVTDRTGNVYFTDEFNVVVRKVDTFGVIRTVAGNGIDSFGGDGGPATAAYMSQVWGMAVGPTGELYITDQSHHRVRKVTPSGTILTFAGTGANSSAGDGGTAAAASFVRPLGIAADHTGNVYIGDQDAFKIRKVSPGGTITTFAGTGFPGGFFGDGGQATAAKFSYIFGLSTDNSGNVYVADGGNNRIRKISPAGIVSTVAGNGSPGFGGDGNPATNALLNNPTGICIDAAGNMLIADNSGQRLRRVDRSGIIRTLAGIGTPGSSGDNGLCTMAEFSSPTTVAVDSAQNIYIADFSNNRIRKITMVLHYTSGRSHHLHICENSPAVLDSILAALDKAIGLADTWSILSGPQYGTAYATYSGAASGAQVIPTGCSYSPPPGFTGDDTLRILVTNGIATDTSTIIITVDPFIYNAGEITGDSTVCAGSTVMLTDTAAGGTWTISNLNAIVDSGLVTGEIAGRDTITYTVTNSCGQASAQKIITVNALPAVGVITGLAELCVGGYVPLTDTVPGGYWSQSNNSLTVLDVHTAQCDVNAIAPGRDTIRYTVVDSVCSATASFAITIDSLPRATITGQQPYLCLGAALNVGGIPGGGAWNTVNGNAFFVPSASGGMLTGVHAGMDTLTYKVTNFCGTATDIFPFEIDTLPASPPLRRVQDVLYAPPGFASYQWLLNGSALPGAVYDSILLTDPGAYSVIVSNLYGCTATSAEQRFPGCGPDQILVFPNPTESIVHILWCRNVTVRVFCMDGRQAGIYHDISDIDLSGLPNADYLLAFYDENGAKIRTKYIAKRTR